MCKRIPPHLEFVGRDHCLICDIEKLKHRIQYLEQGLKMIRDRMGRTQSNSNNYSVGVFEQCFIDNLLEGNVFMGHDKAAPGQDTHCITIARTREDAEDFFQNKVKYAHQHGHNKTFIRWETIAGDKYEGHVVEMDSNVAVVKCSDGQTRTVEI